MKNILIVEDDVYKASAVMNGVKQYFREKREEINLFAESNMESAYNCIRKLNIKEATKLDLIILDIHFPLSAKDFNGNDEAGFLLLDKLKNTDVATPVVINTSFFFNLRTLQKHYPIVIDYIHYKNQNNLHDELKNALTIISEEKEEEIEMN